MVYGVIFSVCSNHGVWYLVYGKWCVTYVLPLLDADAPHVSQLLHLQEEHVHVCVHQGDDKRIAVLAWRGATFWCVGNGE